MAPKFKGFLPRFPKWAVYEMMLVFPFHTGHGFFHSIQVQSRGIRNGHLAYKCSTKSSSHASSTLEAAPADKQQSITRNSEA